MSGVIDLLSPGDIVFDVGANHGFKAHPFLAAGFKVVLVEPQPDLAEQLRRQYGNNINATIIEAAVGSAEGVLPMLVPKESVLATLSSEWTRGRFSGYDWDAAKRIDVRVTTLDSLIEAHGVPRFIKLDVEGFESHAIDGLTRKIEYLSYEWTEEYANNAIDISRKLEKLGVSRFCVAYGEQVPDLDWNSLDELTAILAKARNTGAWGDVYAC